MTLRLAFQFADRLGLLLVFMAFLALSSAYRQPAPLSAQDLLLGLGTIVVGALALGIGYRVVRAALPECSPIALATAAALAVLPGHVAAISSDLRLGMVEVLFGLILLGVVHMARRAAVVQPVPATAPLDYLPSRSPGNERGAGLPGRRPTSAALLGLAIGVATIVALAAMSLVVNSWAGVIQNSVQAVVDWIEAFWLPPVWRESPHRASVLWLLSLVSVMVIIGALRYGVSTMRREADLEEADRSAVLALYLVAGLVVAWAVVLAVTGILPRPTILHVSGPILVLLGIIGFESWFPPMTRPLVVFGLLVGLFALNLLTFAVTE